MGSKCVIGYIVGGLLTVFGCCLLSYPIFVKLCGLHRYHLRTTGSQTGSWEGIINDPLVLADKSVFIPTTQPTYLGKITMTTSYTKPPSWLSAFSKSTTGTNYIYTSLNNVSTICELYI